MHSAANDTIDLFTYSALFWSEGIVFLKFLDQLFLWWLNNFFFVEQMKVNNKYYLINRGSSLTCLMALLCQCQGLEIDVIVAAAECNTLQFMTKSRSYVIASPTHNLFLFPFKCVIWVFPHCFEWVVASCTAEREKAKGCSWVKLAKRQHRKQNGFLFRIKRSIDVKTHPVMMS